MRRLVLTLVAVLAATAAPAYEAVDALLGLRAPRPSKTLRCTDDGLYCISLASYVPDVCSAIERAAGKNGLDPHFFARLLWKESLFEPGAISPVGAMGIAQFMPGTARWSGWTIPSTRPRPSRPRRAIWRADRELWQCGPCRRRL